MPLSIGRTIDFFTIFQGLVVIEPVIDCVVLLRIQLHINRLQRLHLKDVVSIVKRCFFIVEGRKSHSLEMSSISLLSSHHDPHGAPLSSVDGLNYPWNFVNKADSSSYMIENFHCSNLFPWHG